MEKIPELIIGSAASGMMMYLLCTLLNQRRSLDEDNPTAEKHYIPFGPSICMAGLVIFFIEQL
jgi:leader peptidase (prepilin peptidase)/N-methyltransferase